MSENYLDENDFFKSHPVVDNLDFFIYRHPQGIIIDGGIKLTKEWQITIYNKTFVVPVGFYSNFASIPSLGRVFISPVDKSLAIPAIVHDFLVSEGLDIPPKMNWNKSAKALHGLMKSMGANAFKRGMVYRSVRMYGFFARKK